MADLIVKRATAKRDLLRRYAIHIDGECVAHVRAGGATHIKIAEGMRELRLSIDGHSSQAKTILASNHCVAIVNCAPAEYPVPARQSRISILRLAERLPPDRTSYIKVDLDCATELARAFLHAAWSVARYKIGERSKPGEQSRYGLSAGDLSVLYHGCRSPNAAIVTTLGSANDRLWRELVRVHWLAASTIPAIGSGAAVGYRFTELGQIELLEIFDG
ncbi:hypothetical protein [Sphingomonas morindae]|uniref:Uncharacterized protein n=1 Tax=Sphingomonas morindae TaxID=1541170 RepID=A0ABY4XAU1_9SPHN|nr:hypothetical protein [Sphingomonas morindae]USI73796.1 hypothetical protein LHA26_04830 [Sphingomonas morindae]